MSENDDAVGSVQIKVSSAAIHKAVRNILANEMGMSRDAVLQEIRSLAKEVAEKKIEEFTLSYLKDNHYGGAELHNRVKAAMEKQIGDLKPVIKDVARDLVLEAIRTDIEGVVEGVVRDGIKVRLGWNREAQIKVEAAPHARQNWVPVGDRMPPDGKMTLAYHGNLRNDGKEVNPAIHSGGEFRSPGGGVLVKVTHWRFLPDSPACDKD